MANMTLSQAVGILGAEIDKANRGQPGKQAKLISSLSSNFFKGVATTMAYEKYKKNGYAPIASIEPAKARKR